MSNYIQTRPEQLGEALGEILEQYGADLRDTVNKVGEASMKRLVKLTRATAPVGKRGKLRRAITSQAEPNARGDVTYTWYAKAPEHRLVHLVVHGHATKDGGRTRGNPFLGNALSVVLPEYERNIKEAIGRP